MRQIKIHKTITNRDSKLIDTYFTEIGKCEPMSPEEERDVARRAREGDMQAREKLVICNLKFAVSVAKQYQRKGVRLGDLINEAGYGLMKAADKFDETKGFKFISYAVWWIRQSLIKYLNEDNRMIRLPANRVISLSKLDKFIEQTLKNKGREPSQDECCQALDLQDHEYYELISASSPTMSLNKPFLDGESSTLEDVIPSEEFETERQSMAKSKKESVEKVFSLLTDREADAVKAEFGFGGSYETVALKYGISRERVRQLKQRALIVLRSKENAKHLAELLD